MKKLIFVLLIFAVVGISAFADTDWLQYPPSVKGGDILLSAGIGYAGWGNYSGWKMSIPPIVITGEYCLPVGLPISVGGLFSISRYYWEYLNTYKWTHTYVIVAGRGNWHWNFDVNWLDVYTGINLGYRSHSTSYSGPNDWYSNAQSWSYSGVYFGTQVGANFFFTDMFGVNVEVGWPIYIKAALAVKF